MTKNLNALAAAALLCALSPTLLTRNPDGADEPNRSAPPSGPQARYAPFNSTTYNAEARTVELILSAGAAVNRRWWIEELEIAPEAIDLGRVARGLVPLLDSHNRWGIGSVLGQIVSTRFETIDGQKCLIGVARFADTQAGREAEGMVARGELRGVSIGYDVRNWECTHIDLETETRTWRAKAWELQEASLVPVPADPAAGVRSAPNNPGSGDHANPQEDDDMRRSLALGGLAASTALAAGRAVFDQNGPGAAAPAAPAPTAERAEPTPAPAPAAERAAPESATPGNTVTRFSATDALGFTNDATVFGLGARAAELVAQNERGEISVETARSQMLRETAEAQRAALGGAASAPGAVPAGAGARTADSEEATRGAIADALFARATRAQVSEQGRQYMGYRLLELAALRAGLDPRERDASVILRAANTTSDFPLILQGVVHRVLMARYETANPTYREIARRRDLTDFRQTNLVRIGDFPTLKPYEEDGEIKSGTINEGRESVTLGSFGRILRLSRQAIVNDDIGAFDDVVGSIGGMIARFENATAYAVKAQNSGRGPNLADGKSLFHADHGNLAGSGAAPDITTLGAARASLRKQKDLDGNPLNAEARVLLVGPDVETVAQQLTAQIQPVVAGSVNPFAGKLSVVTDGAISGNAWEVYADPNELPVWSYGFLADAPGPRVMTHEPFNTDGMAWRVTLDFYFGAIDSRGAFRNPGA